MKACKDTTCHLSWRIFLCAPNKQFPVGVYPTAYGTAWRRSCQNTHVPARADDRGTIYAAQPTAFFTSFARAANGKPLQRNLVPAAPCTIISSNGRVGTSSISYGSIVYAGTMCCVAFNGSGKVWTDQRPRLPWAGKKTGKNPTDRGKLGVKRSVLTDGRGVPLGVAVGGANVHDQKLFHATLNSIPIRRPRPTARHPQHLCCDKGFDASVIRHEARRRRYRPHIKSRWQEQIAKRTRGHRARRWVVERIASWINRFRRILIRWEKKSTNYESLLHLAFAYTTYRQTKVFG